MHTIRTKKMLTLAHNASGAASIVFALTLTALCGFVALALDYGHLVMAKAELQRTADAGALAGAMGLVPYTNLSNQTPNWANAQYQAHYIISRPANQADNQTFSNTDGTVLYGYWFLQPPTGYVQTQLSTVPTPPAYLPEPAVNVTLRRNITLYFAPIIGVSSSRTVSATATAILPEADTTTGMPPIAVSESTVYETINGTLTIDVDPQTLKIQSNKGSVGWFDLTGDNSVPAVRIDTPITTLSTPIYLVPGSKATLTNYFVAPFVDQVITLAVVSDSDFSQKNSVLIQSFAGFMVTAVSSNSMTGYFLDQYFDPNVIPTAPNGTNSPVSGTPKLVSP
jgi:hypothetical protein